MEMSEKSRARNLILFGNSHARRLLYCFIGNKTVSKHFRIYDFTKPGKTYQELALPLEHLCTEDSILIILCFGNDIFDRNFVKVTKTNNQRIFHLVKFAPTNFRNLQLSYNSLGKWLKTVKSQILLLDNIYRHVPCCEKHFSAEVIRHQFVQNNLLRKYFKSLELKNLTVIDHRKLLPYFQRQLRKINFYSTLLQDAVHLKMEFYEKMAIKLENIYFKRD